MKRSDLFIWLAVGLMANLLEYFWPSPDNYFECNPLIVPAVISARAAIINGLLGVFSKNKANKQNIALQRETNALNYQMFQEGNEFNRQMAFDMFNAENEYNTPAAQAQRLREANLNPALVAEGANATTGNGDASTPSSVSPPAIMAPQVQPVGSPFESIFDNVEKLASAFQKVSSGNLTKAQEEFVLEQAKSERLKQIGQDLSNKIQSAFGMAAEDAKVKNLLKDLEKKDQEISTAVSQGKLYDAERLLKEAQEISQKNQNKLFDSTFEYVIQQEQEKVNLIRQNVKESEAREGEARASEKEHLAGAALKDEQKRTQEQETERRKIENRYADSIDAAAYAGKRSEVLKNLREAYRTGYGLYDSVRDFSHSVLRRLGINPHNREFESLDDMADWLIEDAKEHNK